MAGEGRNLPRRSIAREFVSSTVAHRGWRVSCADTSQPIRKSTNARVDIHIYMRRLICKYRERLRFDPDMATTPVLNIENIVSWRQRQPIIAITVHRDSSNLLFSVAVQDNQRIIE